MKKFIVVLSLVAVMSSLGCVAMSEYLTPAAKDTNAVQYVAGAGVADANDFDGYFNLDKANRLAWAVDQAHELNQLALSQRIERDSLQYAQLSDTVKANVSVAKRQEETLFGERGLLTLGLGLAGFGTLTGFVGFMRKRPGDMTPEDVKRAVSGSEAELGEREEMFIEVVKGVQKFMDSDPDSPSNAKLKGYLGVNQSPGTKQLIGQVKSMF